MEILKRIKTFFSKTCTISREEADVINKKSVSQFKPITAETLEKLKQFKINK